MSFHYYALLMNYLYKQLQSHYIRIVLHTIIMLRQLIQLLKYYQSHHISTANEL